MDEQNEGYQVIPFSFIYNLKVLDVPSKFKLTHGIDTMRRNCKLYDKQANLTHNGKEHCPASSPKLLNCSFNRGHCLIIYKLPNGDSTIILFLRNYHV